MATYNISLRRSQIVRAKTEPLSRADYQIPTRTNLELDTEHRVQVSNPNLKKAEWEFVPAILGSIVTGDQKQRYTSVNIKLNPILDLLPEHILLEALARKKRADHERAKTDHKKTITVKFTPVEGSPTSIDKTVTAEMHHVPDSHIDDDKEAKTQLVAGGGFY